MALHTHCTIKIKQNAVFYHLAKSSSRLRPLQRCAADGVSSKGGDGGGTTKLTVDSTVNFVVSPPPPPFEETPSAAHRYSGRNLLEDLAS